MGKKSFLSQYDLLHSYTLWATMNNVAMGCDMTPQITHDQSQWIWKIDFWISYLVKQMNWSAMIKWLFKGDGKNRWKYSCNNVFSEQLIYLSFCKRTNTKGYFNFKIIAQQGFFWMKEKCVSNVQSYTPEGKFAGTTIN